MTPRLSPLAPEDLDAVVAVHLRAFPTFFLSFLGARFLREFYASFLRSPSAIAWVAKDADGHVVGAIVGMTEPGGYFRRLLRERWLVFALASASAVLRKPAILPRLLRAVTYRGAAPPGPARALLSSLAVAPEAQRHGIGRALVERWTDEALRRGCHGCYLTTDADGNDAVRAFYSRCGWTGVPAYRTPEGRAMLYFIRDFTTGEPHV